MMSESANRLLERRELEDHWMIGQPARASGFVGTIKQAIQHVVEVDGDRQTHTRVVIECEGAAYDGGDLLIDVSSKNCEVTDS